MVIEAVLQCH